MTNFVTDTFTAAGGTNTPPRIFLNTHSGETGHSWAAGDDLAVRTDTDIVGITVGAYSYQHATASAAPPSADYSASMDITVVSTADFTACGPGARVSGANRDSGYFSTVDPNAAELRLERFDSGSRTILGTPYDISGLLGTLPATLANVDVKCEGDQISVLLGGTVVVGPVTDTTYTTAGLSGFYLRAGDPWNEITVDNFSADSLAATVPDVTDIDTDNAVNQYQQAIVNVSDFTETITSVTLGGEACTIPENDPTDDQITVGVPGSLTTGTYDLVISGATETDTLTGVSYTQTHARPAFDGLVDSNSILSGQSYTPNTYFRFVSGFSNGTLDLAAGDTAEWAGDIADYYTPDEGFSGDDTASIQFLYSDGTTSATVGVTVTVAPAVDTTPDQFDLGANVTGAEPGATIQRTFVLSGIDAGETVSPTATGSATVSPSTAQDGDTITVEVTAGTYEQLVSGGVSINGVSDSFSVTTRAAIVPVQDVALPDLNLGETDPVLIDLDDYFSGAVSYSVSGLPAGSGLSFDGTVISGETNKDDIVASPFTLTVSATSAEGSIQDSFSVTVVDDIAPAVTIGDLTTLDTTPIASGSAGDATSLALVVEGVDVTHTSSYNPTPSNGSWAQQLSELAIGTYTMTLTGTDDAGNESVETATLKVVDEITTSPRGLFQPLFRSLTGSVNQTLFR